MSCTLCLNKSDFQAHLILKEYACAHVCPWAWIQRHSLKLSSLWHWKISFVCISSHLSGEEKELGIAGLNPSKSKTCKVKTEHGARGPSLWEAGAGWPQNHYPEFSCGLVLAFWTQPACYSSGVYSIMGPRTVSAPDCLRSLGNSERKPFKSAFLENAKPAKLGQTLYWVSLRGDSEISRRAGNFRGTLIVSRGPEGKRDEICVSIEWVIFSISKPDVKSHWFLVIYRLRT